MFTFVLIIFARVAIDSAPVPPRGTCDVLCAEAYSYYVIGGGAR